LKYRSRTAARSLKPLFFMAAAAASLVWAGATLRDWWNRAEIFTVRRVTIPSEAPAGMDRALGVAAGDRLFGFSPRETARRLHTQFPELASVRVRRGLAGDVRLEIQRRRPRARLWKDGQWYGMDGEGLLFPMRIFGPEDAPVEAQEGKGLVILAGAAGGASAVPFLDFMELVGRLPQSWARGFYKMKLAPAGEAVLFLKDGPAVHWGEPAADALVIQAKAERLERVLKDERLLLGVETVRFVDDRRLAVKPKEEKKEEDPLPRLALKKGKGKSGK
jgi:cell division septal protein FtsQ